MKKILFLCSVLCLVLFACQDEEDYNDTIAETTAVRFRLTIPGQKTIKTRAASYENAVNDLWLMVFDNNGLFLKRVQATDLVSDESGGIGIGSFKAEVPVNAGIIHFIANCDQLRTYDDKIALRKDEREVIPPLSGDQLAFWGRNVITSLTAPIDVVLYRNQAKITLENQAPNFAVSGYAICNYFTVGTIAPFNPDATPTPFILLEDTPTIPQGDVAKDDQTEADCDMTPKYTFANPNYFNDQAYVIVKGSLNGGTELFYKIQLLDDNKQPYPIVRNSLYRVAIRSFSENANGSSSFDDAKSSEPSNNIYAEISKDSPTISDDNNNVLTVSGLNFLYTQGGALNVETHYTKNGVLSDSEISVSVVEDKSNILSNLSYDNNGNLTANVAKIIAGLQTATISVKAGSLSRIITVTSSELYRFDPVTLSPAVYTGKDEEITVNFNIPNGIPSYLYPVQCAISTGNLYPVSPNQDLEIEYVDGTYKYIYWAEKEGSVSLNFKTAFENSDETVTIENQYFRTGTVDLKARHFQNVSINNNNLVNYGTNSTAVLRFTIPAYADIPPTFPLTIFVTTNNLRTSQAGWTAVSGGYTYTYNSPPAGVQTVTFTSNKDISMETMVLSAEGFSPTTISFDNILNRNISISGAVRVYTNNTYYTIPGYTVTSSNTSIIRSFRVNTSSNYTATLLTNSRLSDTVTFSSSGYVASYTVEQLLGMPTIILR